MISKSRTLTCSECSQEFHHEPVIFQSKEVFRPVHCDPCNERIVANRERLQADAEKREWMKRFELMVPPAYLDTDPSKLSAGLRQVISGYDGSGRGIGLVGPAGSGKTRAAVLMLRQCQEAGKNTFFLASTDFARMSSAQFADNPALRDIAQSSIRLCKFAEVLLLDDVGKARFTDRVESDFYDLLEWRTSRKLPTLWTSNSDAAGLMEMFSKDRAEAIVRRLGTEFSTIVKL